MKNALIYFTVLIFSLPIQAQKKGAKKAHLNEAYLTSVSMQDAPDIINRMQEAVANFKVKKIESFNWKADGTCEYTFEIPACKIVAAYDKAGTVLNTLEEYQDVKVPYNFVEMVQNEYQNAMIVASKFSIAYSNEKATRKSLQLSILNNNQTMELNFDITDSFESVSTLAGSVRE